jgi:hypothetical protein
VWEPIDTDWLAEHDRQVAEKAWDDGFDSGFDHETVRAAIASPTIDLRLNPHRATSSSVPPTEGADRG